MKARWALLFFAAGLGAGRLIFGGSMRVSAEADGNQTAAPVVIKREVRPAMSANNAKWRSLAKELPSLSFEDKEALRNALAPGDRAAVIDALLAQAGPDGIPTEAKSILGEIIMTWAEKDFDGAWAWCQRIESDASRKFVASHLLTQLVGKDPDRAFALYLETAAGDPTFCLLVPIPFLRTAGSKDAASFLDLLGKLPFGSGGGVTTVDFAADFDFQQAADGVTALKKNHEGNTPSVFPINFLSTWAERDADAAYAWFSKNEASPFENFGSLLEGIEKQGIPGASYTWAADKFNEPGTARDAMIRSLTDLDSIRGPFTIISIAQAMPDAANRNRFLDDVVMTAKFSDSAVALSYALTQMSTPAARLETLQRIAKDGNLNPSKIPDSQLQQWGLTRQQVEQAAQN